MRRKTRQTSEEEAWDLFSEVGTVTLATTTPEGAPILRVLNSVVHEGHLYFHGAIGGEKSSSLGRNAVVSAHVEVAFIPSTFVDPEKATPATTFYRSAQAEGPLVDVTSPDEKASILQALMEKHQPEGGYVPLSATLALYKKDLRSTRVFGVRVHRVMGKKNMGQDKPQEVCDQILSGLWRRGAPGDLRALREIVEARPYPPPAWLTGPLDTELCVYLQNDEADDVARLLLEHYWRADEPLSRLAASLRGSPIWVGARAPSGQWVGMARGLSDGTLMGSIHDVVVRPDYQKGGLGRALVQLLLEHPGLRETRLLRLGTMDKMHFYEHFGFQPAEAVPLGFMSHQMVLKRA